VRAALFPRYLFTALDLDHDRWRSVNGTFGVTSLVGADGRPDPVPEGVVEALLDRQDASGTIRFNLRESQAVRVLAGPFSDVIGVIERLDDNGRVRVLLDMMGSKVPAIVADSYVAPVA